MCDLTKQSVWHQKSRICDVHMSGMFFKQGKLQQFCQQCGRSHNLDAFDKGRRSCRTQLAKHAARSGPGIVTNFVPNVCMYLYSCTPPTQ